MAKQTKQPQHAKESDAVAVTETTVTDQPSVMDMEKAHVNELAEDEVIEPTTIEDHTPGVYVAKDQQRYEFKRSTPAKLQIDGVAVLVTDLLHDAEKMEDLIASRCIFLTKIL